MTKVIELWGGPGCGKSTLAGELYVHLKKQGKNVELVREYVKDWAYENRKIGVYDQIYISGKQCRKEYLLYGKVDYIITDSPIMIGPFYMQHYQNKNYVLGAVKGIEQEALENDVTRERFLLRRNKKYNPVGRYENEDEAKIIDSRMWDFLSDNYLNFTYLDCKDDDKAGLILGSRA